MDYIKQSDACLMDLIQTCDVDGFDTLRLRYMQPIFCHLLSIVHDEYSAEDLLQETFLRVWTRADQWDGRGTVRSWLFRISTNMALNLLRSRSRKKEIPLDGILKDEDDDSLVPAWMVDSITPGPETALANTERIATLRRLVDGLPEEKRELIRLVYDIEMEVKEAALLLGIPEGTAKSRLHYSTKYLAREWRNEENE